MPKPWSLDQLPKRYQEQAKAQMPERVGIPAAFKRKKGRPEGELQDEVCSFLQARGYLVAFFRPAKVTRGGVEKYETPVGGDAKGWPDIIAVHPQTGAFLVMELKSEEGRVRDEQLDWLKAFLGVQGATVLIVRPSSWKDLEKLL